ncbi:SRPBCC family protein [Pseudomonas sp. R5(2019)]|uniref:SRPBCC family protein n=1 Tax=Pseudomonas sp. R5(2019) TaxID=2697566 RepID=UPI0014135C41|nr:SRPBCC family protein [Pseudomonas sp. R5(2019)]NBA93639.1 DUF1857 family protein [Pseudomonas sp. R5(2019)]
MITVSRRLEVNPATEATHLNKDQVWQGLVNKARNAVPYVSAISRCDVIEEQGDRLIREVELHGETLRELITFIPQERVEFVRISGNARGIIKNIIEEEGGNLYLRFTFDFTLVGVEANSPQEAEFAKGMEAAYLAAVNSTLKQMRESSSKAA